MNRTTQTDEEFEEEFEQGRRCQRQVYFWLQDHHFNVKLEKYHLRKRGEEAKAAQRGERTDYPDLWLPDLGCAIEVKGRNVQFKYCDYYPFPTVRLMRQYSLEKYKASGIPRAAVVIVSIPTLHMLAVPWRPDDWWPEQASYHGRFNFPVMACFPDQLRSMSWLYEHLTEMTQ